MSSVYNSTTTPLAGSATYTGSTEGCKQYTTISCMVKADSNCTLLIDHGDSSGNWDISDSFAVVSGTSLWKQTHVKGSHFRCRVVNGVSVQTYLRLYTKLLLHSVADDLKVSLDSGDTVSSILKDAGGNAVSVSANKLVVSQNTLSNTTDNVLEYAWDGSANQKVSCNASGHLNTVKNALSQATDSVLSYGNDGSTNRALKTDTAGKLEVVSSGSSQLSYVNSTLQTTPIEVKASSGNVCGVQIFNDSVTAKNIRLHDKSTEPVAADAPKIYWEVDAASSLVIPCLNVAFSNKIYVVASGTRGTTSAFESVNANELSVCLQYV